MVGLKGRPAWDAEGWRKPGEVSSKDYRMIRVGKTGGKHLYDLFLADERTGMHRGCDFSKVSEK